MALMRAPVKEGEMTKTVYHHIMEQHYDDAIRILNQELQNFPTSRCALSLLGYCYYHQQNFHQASQAYGQLVEVCPDVDEYKIHHVQSLMKAGLWEEASHACTGIESGDYTERVMLLQAAISYEQDEVQLARSILDQCSPNDEERQVFEGALLWKEKRHPEAMKQFTDAMNTAGHQPDLAYNIALCYYSMKQYGPALKHIADIIEKGVRDHPELSVGALSEAGGGLQARSVGNTGALKETALVEAFNLKAAIEYMMKNSEAARDALNDMPPRDESELDAVTLHNQALLEMDDKPTEGFRKLNFLLHQHPSPPETFANLLLLYCKHSYYDLAADILAENPELTYKCMKAEEYEFLDALILGQSSPEEAYRRFDELSAKHIDALRKGTKNIQDARRHREQNQVKKYLNDFDEALTKYIPVLMGQAKIYWDLEHYSMVEKIFRQSAEFCSEDESWKLNVAHIFFMQEKFKECIRYYEPFVRKHYENLLNVTAIILANLCVAYVMTSANEEAEELMRLVEKEEEKLDPSKPTYHLCIINLVIGTLYCAKGNFEFGVSRIIKSLEPYDRKIGIDTWYYAKRCFLALGESLGKNMVLLKDEAFEDLINFFDAAAQHGKNIPTSVNILDSPETAGKQRTVAVEARLFKRFFLKMRD
jgi:tetratricopeptide repeat protein 30